jgi:hypothetical protein
VSVAEWTPRSAAGPHEGDKRGLLGFGHGQFAGGEEHHGRIVPQVLGREGRDILRGRDLEAAGRLADLLEHGLGGRYDLVPVAGRVGEIEDAVGPALGVRGRSGERRAERDRKPPGSSGIARGNTTS